MSDNTFFDVLFFMVTGYFMLGWLIDRFRP